MNIATKFNVYKPIHRIVGQNCLSVKMKNIMISFFKFVRF
jgi:hypothetical protein